MKRTKKVFALFMTMVLAVSMLLAMSITSFADDGYSISLKSTDTHTYKVYQILTGTLASEGAQSLGNAAWGADAKAEGSVSDFVASLEGKSEQDIAQLVGAQINPSAAGRGTVTASEPIEGLAAGYYILVDVTEIQATSDGKIDTKALHVVRVVNDIEDMDIKYGTTEDDKIIASDTLGKSGEDVNVINGDTDNVSIGDTVNYQITAKVPENANKFNYFYFVINDTLDSGLTFDADSVKVYKDSISDANLLVSGTDYLLRTGDDADGKTFQVGLVDAKSLAGKNIIVTYSAVLNENAEIGEVPNKNTSTVTFSNDPNHDYNGDPDNPSPGFPDQEDLSALGETPKTETETFTTGIEIQKVDENGEVLLGAEFTITGDSEKIVLVSEETFTADADGEYYKLKDGRYTKDAPVEADYMKPAAAGATAGYVVAESDYEGTDTVTVGGTVYRPVKADDEGDVFILVKANANQYEDGKYAKTVTYTQKNSTEGVAVTAEVGADGVVSFIGLGAGTYTITETKTPDGYNTVAPVEVKISFAANGDPHWSTTSDATYNEDSGVFEVTIVNQKGAELPSTGGIGTVIFYVLGSLLVVGCGIVLISRRRMENR